ncbi:MAG: hypothetical protein NT007_06445 [Candidatus Kapabacteria bacterium]|nr:hypothetical protein [Candidatus Kapabacteria bacterium]
MNNSANINCVELQRDIRSQMSEEASFDIRKLMDQVNENTKDDKILQKFYKSINKDRHLTAA